MKITQEMWAVGWATYHNENYPSPLKTGAWVIAADKSIAENKRIYPKQKIERVLVTITEIKPKKGKGKK